MEKEELKIEIVATNKTYVYGGNLNHHELVNALRWSYPWYEFIDENGLPQAVHTGQIISVETCKK